MYYMFFWFKNEAICPSPFSNGWNNDNKNKLGRHEVCITEIKDFSGGVSLIHIFLISMKLNN